jgi:hypothetical protein
VFFKEKLIVKYMYGLFYSSSFQRYLKKKESMGGFSKTQLLLTLHVLSMQALSDVFGDRIISSDIWPARSPDPNPCDFFFWGYLKGKVCSNNPRTEEELEENSHREISNIPAVHLQR